MPWMLLALVFVLTWAGSALLINSYARRTTRPSLADRLRPFQPSIADEAEFWLRRLPWPGPGRSSDHS